MRQFFLGVLVGIVIGAVGMMIYAEWADSGADEAGIQGPIRASPDATREKYRSLP
jgi:hypothetical protein